MDGIIIVDKPKGLTSRAVVDKVKRILNVKKAGHVGTLDPIATGVLPIFVGKATKLVEIMSRSDKEYVGEMRLHKDVSKEDLENAMKKFTGVIEQVPPVRSAVKRQKRKRRIYEFALLSKSGRIAEFRVKCEAGTYVRKLIHDMGQELGGAHMFSLRRTAAGPFKITDAIPLERAKEKILPIDVLKKYYKKVYLKKTAEYSVTHGSPIFSGGVLRNDALERGELFLILDHDGDILGLGEFVGERMFGKVKSIIRVVSKSETKF